MFPSPYFYPQSLVSNLDPGAALYLYRGPSAPPPALQRPLVPRILLHGLQGGSDPPPPPPPPLPPMSGGLSRPAQRWADLFFGVLHLCRFELRVKGDTDKDVTNTTKWFQAFVWRGIGWTWKVFFPVFFCPAAYRAAGHELYLLFIYFSWVKQSIYVFIWSEFQYFVVIYSKIEKAGELKSNAN